MPAALSVGEQRCQLLEAIAADGRVGCLGEEVLDALELILRFVGPGSAGGVIPGPAAGARAVACPTGGGRAAALSGSASRTLTAVLGVLLLGVREEVNRVG